jgi:uncharacterized protein (DUF433 family)
MDYKPVYRLEQVIKNIATYNEQKSEPALLGVMSYVRDWYAVRVKAGGWLFAPSKFIGYQDMDHARYGLDKRKVLRKRLDGRETEKSLAEWFVELSPSSGLAVTLLDELKRVLASHGKPLNARACIHVLKEEAQTASMDARRSGTRLVGLSRITADPAILGGKPCIRGMRIRVADVLEMLALGATRAAILEDYPYLEDEDITAALEYAMSSVDHRLIKAA